MNSRTRYPPPGIAASGGGGGTAAQNNPGGPYQQYPQRNQMYNNQSSQYNNQSNRYNNQSSQYNNQSNQYNMQQQWLKRNQLGSDNAVDKIEKRVQPEGVDSRSRIGLSQSRPPMPKSKYKYPDKMPAKLPPQKRDIRKLYPPRPPPLDFL